MDEYDAEVTRIKKHYDRKAMPWLISLVASLFTFAVVSYVVWQVFDGPMSWLVNGATLALFLIGGVHFIAVMRIGIKSANEILKIPRP